MRAPPDKRYVHGRELSPVDGRPAWPLVDSWSLQGDPGERLAGLCEQLQREAPIPLRVWRRWQAPASLETLARAADGTRLLWLPEHGDPFPHWQLLRAIGRRQLPVKLICTYDADLATWGDWASLAGWWIAAPSHPRECRALLRRMLDEEWPSIALLPSAWQEIGGREHFAWGEATVCGDDAEVCLLAAPDALGIALEARARLHELGLPATVMPCTSISPLPAAAVRARERGLVVVIDRGRSWAGIGGVCQRLRPAPDCSYCDGDHGLRAPPLPADVVALVRIQLGL